jgi:hypothetical protein
MEFGGHPVLMHHSQLQPNSAYRNYSYLRRASLPSQSKHREAGGKEIMAIQLGGVTVRD